MTPECPECEYPLARTSDDRWYCHRCLSHWETGDLPAQGATPHADTVARYPKIGSAALITSSGGTAILLGRRGKQPNYGRWVMPGGKIEWGETIDDAAVREVREETGLTVKIVARLGIFEIVEPDEHSMFVLSEVVVVGGDLQAGDDLSEVAWWPRRHLDRVHLSDPCRAALNAVGWLPTNDSTGAP